VGLFWTAVCAEIKGRTSCGLAASLSNSEYEHARLPAVREAGYLNQRPALELANWVFNDSQTESAIGLATINALLPPVQNSVELAAEDYIAQQGPQSSVALIGHFPFVTKLRSQVKQLWVLELNPQEGDLPASAAPEIIPQADILAITATTLVNHTFQEVMRHRRPHTRVLLLGPSTPVSPILFDYGIHVLSGSIVDDVDQVLPLVTQGATFRQMRDHGVRLVTIHSDG
jgi:hypothetical protein